MVGYPTDSWIQLWPLFGGEGNGRTISYNPGTDTLSIDGVLWSGCVLESFMREGTTRVLAVSRRGNEVFCEVGAHPIARVLSFDTPISKTPPLEGVGEEPWGR